MYRLLWVIFVLIKISENRASGYKPSEKCGDPLILTPLIKKGLIDSAVEESKVTPLLPDVFSHSGFLTVNESTNSNLFFWFFKQSSSEWRTRPVVLWLLGGPGSSSMTGLFSENGPFRVKNGKLVKSKYSWNNHYNVLYIDNPVGAGFSFGSYVSTEKEIGEYLFNAITQFLTMFPELDKNQFIISGESYAGKFIPVLGYEIYKRNPRASVPINLKGLFIGNGYSDSENMLDYAQHLHRLGLIDHRQKLIMQKHEEEAKILIRNARWRQATNATFNVLNGLRIFSNFSYLFDYIREDFQVDISYVKFMNDDNFRKSIHVGRVPFESHSIKAQEHLFEDICRSVKGLIEELLEVYPIMFVSGQLDIIVAHYLTSNFIGQLHWSGADKYSEAKRNMWYVNNHLVGYYKSAGNLKEALVRDARHMISTKHPFYILDLLNKFVNDEI